MRDIVLKGEDARPDSAVRQVVDYTQDRQHDFSEEAFTTASISERELKFAKIGATLYLYTRFNDTIYRVALS